MLDLSRVWPEWKAVEKLGEGSFGKVYRCEREEYGIKSVCAIKVISIPQSQAEIESMSFEGITADGARTYYSDVVNDFANEIKLMEMLKGAPNVVSVENYKIVERENEIGWDIYIRMEYLQSFVSYSKSRKFSEAEVKKFALDISNALDVCSKSGVIHRDVKPDNIFVDKFGSFKLGDFGVARRLEGSMSMMSKKGTYSYMAPEVFKGEKYDNRADFYSLGMVMYKLLNRNRDPFIDLNAPVITFKERNEAIERRRSGEKLPAPVDASPAMAAIILKACEYKPENRFANVEDFRVALLGGYTPVMQDEPTAEANDYTEKTVAAKDIELPTPVYIEADYNDETVVIAPVSEEVTEIMVEESMPWAGERAIKILSDETAVMSSEEQIPTVTSSPYIISLADTELNNASPSFNNNVNKFYQIGSLIKKLIKKYETNIKYFLAAVLFGVHIILSNYCAFYIVRHSFIFYNVSQYIGIPFLFYSNIPLILFIASFVFWSYFRKNILVSSLGILFLNFLPLLMFFIDRNFIGKMIFLITVFPLSILMIFVWVNWNKGCFSKNINNDKVAFLNSKASFIINTLLNILFAFLNLHAELLFLYLSVILIVLNYLAFKFAGRWNIIIKAVSVLYMIFVLHYFWSESYQLLFVLLSTVLAFIQVIVVFFTKYTKVSGEK